MPNSSQLLDQCFDEVARQAKPLLGRCVEAAVASLQLQFEEIVRKDKIPMEQGESDMIKMLDTTRAIPSTPIK